MKHLVTVITALALMHLASAQTILQTGLTNGSAFLDLDGQELVLDNIPAEFRFEAELVYETSQADLTSASFHAACDGLSNTLVIARSTDGNVFGGYNEGVWSSDNTSQENLDNNFLFSAESGEIFTAVPGETHITNNSAGGPNFGDNSGQAIKFFSDASSAVFMQNVLGVTYTCPTSQNCTCLLNNGICLDGFTDRFRVSDYEIWQLKTSGVPAFAVTVDYNEDGIADTYGDCYAQSDRMFPVSQLLTDKQDALLASWVPEEYLYEASPLFSSNNATVGEQNFLNNVAGFLNTMIIIRTGQGQIIGGFNEGFWTASTFNQSNLDNNFIFNISEKRRHLALPGEIHIKTGASMEFGDDDLNLFLQFDEHYSELNNYDSTSAGPENTGTYDYLTHEDAFAIDRIEVWVLNDSGNAIFLPVDEDNNGICDHLDINNFIMTSESCLGDLNNDGSVTSADLTQFLAVFGTTCN